MSKQFHFGNIDYLRRKNLGNFEHEEAKISIVIDRDQCSVEGGRALKKFMHDFLYETGDFEGCTPTPTQPATTQKSSSQSSSTTTQSVTRPSTVEEDKAKAKAAADKAKAEADAKALADKAVKEASDKAKADKAASDKVAKDSKANESKEAKKTDEKKEESKTSEAKSDAGKAEDKEKVETPEKADGGKKGKATRNTPYDRTNELHKAEVRKFMDEEYPEWADDDKIDGFIAASKKLDGDKDFMDSEGNVLSEFKLKFKEKGIELNKK